MKKIRLNLITINDEKLDRRIKLIHRQKELIKYAYENYDYSMTFLADAFNVCRTTIKHIIEPEWYQMRLQQDYDKHRKAVSKEKRNEYMRRHRSYKKELYKEGLITNLPKN